jgi:hypothetical protein
MSIALSKDPRYRFESARELVDAFCDACSSALSPTMRARGLASVRAQPWNRPIPQVGRLLTG